MVQVRAGQANILFWFPSYRSMIEEGLHVERAPSLGLPSYGLFHPSQSITTHTTMQGFLTRPLIQLINVSSFLTRTLMQLINVSGFLTRTLTQLINVPETYLASTHLLKCIQKKSIKNTFGVTKVTLLHNKHNKRLCWCNEKDYYCGQVFGKEGKLAAFRYSCFRKKEEAVQIRGCLTGSSFDQLVHCALSLWKISL